MQISQPETYWDTVRRHTRTLNAKAPWPVVYAVAALLGEYKIKVKGSWTLYKPQEPKGHTTWAVFIVTAKRLVHVHLRFNAEGHGLNENNDNPAASTVEAAWVRRLRTITSISIGGAETAPPGNVPPEWFGVSDVGIGFADDAQVMVPIDQCDESDRRRSDTFLAAIRTGAAL